MPLAAARRAGARAPAGHSGPPTCRASSTSSAGPASDSRRGTPPRAREPQAAGPPQGRLPTGVHRGNLPCPSKDCAFREAGHDSGECLAKGLTCEEPRNSIEAGPAIYRESLKDAGAGYPGGVTAPRARQKRKVAKESRLSFGALPS